MSAALRRGSDSGSIRCWNSSDRIVRRVSQCEGGAMAIVAQTANKEELRRKILDAVQEMYSEVAACPAKGFHFPVGRPACEYLGYSRAELDSIPATAVESFAVVGDTLNSDILWKGATAC